MMPQYHRKENMDKRVKNHESKDAISQRKNKKIGMRDGIPLEIFMALGGNLARSQTPKILLSENLRKKEIFLKIFKMQ